MFEDGLGVEGGGQFEKVRGKELAAFGARPARKDREGGGLEGGKEAIKVSKDEQDGVAELANGKRKDANVEV